MIEILMSSIEGFFSAVQIRVHERAEAIGQTIEQDIDAERIQIELEEFEFAVLGLNLVHPCLHILLVSTPALKELRPSANEYCGPEVP
jgi:hypothetical protein